MFTTLNSSNADVDLDLDSADADPRYGSQNGFGLVSQRDLLRVGGNHGCR